MILGQKASAETVRQQQSCFIGKMTAGFTLDFRKNLAAIQETTVRLGNLLTQAVEKEKDRDKYLDILATIEGQVAMANQSNHLLHRFACRLGKAAFYPLDVGEVVEEVVRFSTRLARLHRLSIEFERAPELPAIHGDPDRIHFLVSVIIHDMVEQTKQGGTITVRLKSAEHRVRIEVEGLPSSTEADPLSEGAARFRMVAQQVLADLGCHLETTATDTGMSRIALLLPIEES